MLFGRAHIIGLLTDLLLLFENFRIQEEEFIQKWITVVFANKDERTKTLESLKVKSLSVLFATVHC